MVFFLKNYINLAANIDVIEKDQFFVISWSTAVRNLSGMQRLLTAVEMTERRFF